MKENIEITRFANGLTILTEKMPDVRSATLGFFFKKGSRHEPANLNGISHFIEHTVFKGTEKRSALQIAVETDRLGGNFDAFTMQEMTGFAMKTVDKDLPRAFDLLADMLTNPRFDETELEREQQVIIEEMRMVEDSPEEYLGEIFNQAIFPNHALGFPIEGTEKTVRTFNREVTSDFHRRVFQPENLVVAVAGNVRHAPIVELAEKFFGQRSAVSRQPSAFEEFSIPQISAPILLKKKGGLEQAHFVLATPWIDARSERRYAAHLLENVLGNGTSSRLWQTIRERHGLAYSVGASGVSFLDCGFFSVYAGTAPEQIGKAIDLAVAELKRIKREGVSAEEIELAKQQSVATILLGLEDSSNRTANLAQQEITFGKQIPLEETLQNIENVTADEIRALAQEFFQTERIALAVLGNLNGLKIDRARLDVS
ncbi:MAG TPA: pitrilysin family protein [Pyrinomonadaceae bacterium]|nr:pitrilysin family protein [Pyrinomonadaceae bacterium]